MNTLRFTLAKTLAVITRHDRYFPVVEWSGNSWTHNAFRAYEWLFGRRYGVRCESAVTAHYENGMVQIHRRFYTVEALLAHTESLIRAKIAGWKFEPNPIYGHAILEIFGYKRVFVYDNGMIDRMGYRFAIAFDASSNGGLGTTISTRSWAHTCSGSDRVINIGAMYPTAGTLTSTTYNSVTATAIGTTQTSAGGVKIDLQRLVAPATGSNTAAVNTSASVAYLVGVAVSFTGVDQTTPIDTSAQSSPAATNNVTQSITTGVDNAMLVGWFRDDMGRAVNGGTNTTVLVDGAGQGFHLTRATSLITPAGSASQILSTQNGDSPAWAAIVASLKPVSAAVVNSNFLTFM